MTVARTDSRVQYQGNDTATAFPFQYKVFDKSHLYVIRSTPGTDGTTMIDIPLVCDTDYTVTGIGSNNGGTVTYPIPEGVTPLPTGDKLTIYRRTPQTQLVAQNNQQSYDATVEERFKDTTTHLIQEAFDEIDRAIKVGKTHEGIDGEQAYEQVLQAISDAAAAQTKADNAILTANSAEAKADIAVTTANAAVSTAGTALTAANAAVATANTANGNANTAVATANSADAKADIAINTANNALDSATTASAAASAAMDYSSAALSTAGTALTTAQAAYAATTRTDGTTAISIAEAAAIKAEIAKAASDGAVSSAGQVYELLPQAMDAATTASAAATSATAAAEAATAAAEAALAAAHTHGSYSFLESLSEANGRMYFGTTGTANLPEVQSAQNAADAAQDSADAAQATADSAATTASSALTLAGTKCAIDDTQTAGTTTYSSAKIEEKIGSGGGGLLPIGAILPFAGATAPSGALICDGSWVSKTTYAALYAVIGDAYDWDDERGSHEGDFKLPDLTGRFLEGKPSAGTLGSAVAAGLPNITGGFGSSDWCVPNWGNQSGAFYPVYYAGVHRSTNSGGQYTAPSITGLNAASSSSVYGASATVQPPAVLVNYIIIAGV